MRKWILATAAIVVGLIVITGGAQAPVTLRFWHTYSTDSAELRTLETQVIPAFERANAGIRVVSQQFPYPDFRQAMLTAIAGGTPPDVARIDIIWSPEFAELGILERLDTRPGFAAIRDAVFPGPLSTNRWNDAYYGLPLTTNTQILLYDRAALARAGVSPPATFAGFNEAIAKLSGQVGGRRVFGYAIPAPHAWFLLPWIWSNGGAITDDAVTRASGYLNSPATVEIVERLVAQYRSGQMAPTLGGSGIGTWEGLGTGLYAMTQDGPWAPPAIAAQFPGLDLGVAPFPAGPAGSISIVGGENIVIFKDGRNKDAAWRFVRFMLSLETQMTMAPTGQIPVLAAAVNEPFIRNHEFLPQYLRQLQSAKARTPHPAYTRMEEIMHTAFQLIVAGNRSTREALDAAAAQIDGLLR
jgi:multiple sugar transport system substrate-binding protein